MKTQIMKLHLIQTLLELSLLHSKQAILERRGARIRRETKPNLSIRLNEKLSKETLRTMMLKTVRRVRVAAKPRVQVMTVSLPKAAKG